MLCSTRRNSSVSSCATRGYLTSMKTWGAELRHRLCGYRDDARTVAQSLPNMLSCNKYFLQCLQLTLLPMCSSYGLDIDSLYIISSNNIYIHHVLINNIYKYIILHIIHTYTRMRTYVRTYIHTYIYTCIHAYMHTY